MHIHIIGIAGAMTAPLAQALKKQGHYITGSDQAKIYPPFSQLLQKNKIPVNTTPINSKINLVIVGSSFNSFENTKQEFLAVKKQKIPYISATDYIGKYLGKKNSILVAGSYGKTTITSILSWIFTKANLHPNTMFGGSPINHFDPIKITDSDWSIIEADESIHGLDKFGKFLYYPSKYLILTSADWEHKDCYSSESENFSAFKQLVERLPSDGILLINSKGYQTAKLSNYSKSKVVTYNSPDSDYYLNTIKTDQYKTKLIIQTPNDTIVLNTVLFGQFNYENILAAVALANCLGIKTKTIQSAVATYRGIKRRMELVNQINNRLFFDDFAQSSQRISSALETLRCKYPHKTIKVLFQPHASFLQHAKSLSELKSSFSEATEVVLGKISFQKDKSKRITANDYRKHIGDKLIYIPIKKDIVNHYIQTLKPNDIMIQMSSGGQSSHQIIKAVINNFKKNV